MEDASQREALVDQAEHVEHALAGESWCEAGAHWTTEEVSHSYCWPCYAYYLS